MSSFIDQVEITVRSGKGGDGMVHFLREKYRPRGGPDGGDGGHGGDVVFEVDARLNTLFAFQRQRLHKAQDGAGGGTNNQTGRSGEHLVVPVPPGTEVYDLENGNLVGDLLEPQQRLVAAHGGRGGRGNARFASARNKAPRLAEKGEPAVERRLRLELKLIADVGIVGVPNAGKSTLLAALSKARPKIADYPFTTLAPNLGVASLDEDTTLVLADIPGLIEGAHMGVGLGHDFLRHVQRTRALIHLLDGLSEDPLADLSQINSELALFDPDLADKPVVVALNKLDLPQVQERWPSLEGELKKRGYQPAAISAVAGTGVRELLFRAAQLAQEAPEPVRTDDVPLYRQEEDPAQFEVTREADAWRVSGKAIERAAAMTYWEFDQSRRRFQRIMEALGIDKALRAQGIQEGDTVLIGEYELEWED